MTSRASALSRMSSRRSRRSRPATRSMTSRSSTRLFAAISIYPFLTDLSGAPSHFSQRARSEEHTSELQSLMRISYAVFFLTQKTIHHTELTYQNNHRRPKPEHRLKQRLNHIP